MNRVIPNRCVVRHGKVDEMFVRNGKLRVFYVYPPGIPANLIIEDQITTDGEVIALDTIDGRKRLIIDYSE